MRLLDGQFQVKHVVGEEGGGVIPLKLSSHSVVGPGSSL